ncbi:MAG TPA: alpha/beta fold hydrolase [Methylomirabilota bacterium]|jgi:pimeloyl-ACP methyl ester carboxylesterase|nr:alpha/beta fold hydrolase [Methylomirabilota bacterium]
MPTEFVLVHGAMHGAWCWEDVAARLTEKGHRVVAPDLPGHGRRAAEVRRAGAAAYGRAIADAMAAAGVSRAVLVGHSMGGLVIAKAAELVPGRIAHLVFLAAVVPAHGSSIAETNMTAPARAALASHVTGRGDGTFHHSAETAWARWMGDLPRTDPRVSRALSLLTPQAARPFFERVDLRRFDALAIPRTYIRCRRDMAVVPARAAAVAARLGVAPVDLDSAHNPMLSQPDDLVRLLTRIA